MILLSQISNPIGTWKCECGAAFPDTDPARWRAFAYEAPTVRQLCPKCVERDFRDVHAIMQDLAATGMVLPIDRPPLALVVDADQQDFAYARCSNYSANGCEELAVPRRLELTHLPGGPVRLRCPRCTDARLPDEWRDWLHMFNASKALPPIPAPAPVVPTPEQLAAEREEHWHVQIAEALSQKTIDGKKLPTLEGAARIIAVMKEMIADATR